jgi:hypothetical protein
MVANSGDTQWRFRAISKGMEVILNMWYCMVLFIIARWEEITTS